MLTNVRARNVLVRIALYWRMVPRWWQLVWEIRKAVDGMAGSLARVLKCSCRGKERGVRESPPQRRPLLPPSPLQNAFLADPENAPLRHPP